MFHSLTFWDQEEKDFRTLRLNKAVSRPPSDFRFSDRKFLLLQGYNVIVADAAFKHFTSRASEGNFVHRFHG
jgi:hypothetical protein